MTDDKIDGLTKELSYIRSALHELDKKVALNSAKISEIPEKISVTISRSCDVCKLNVEFELAKLRDKMIVTADVWFILGKMGAFIVGVSGVLFGIWAIIGG